MAKNNIITSVLMIPELSERSYRKANRIFLDNKKKGIIIYGYFNDDAWVVTDEYATFSLNFEIDEEEKIVVALAASIMAGDGIPNPNLHIKRITRIS